MITTTTTNVMMTEKKMTMMVIKDRFFVSYLKLSCRYDESCIRKMYMRDSRGWIGLTEDQTPSPSEWELSKDARLNFDPSHSQRPSTLRSPTQRLWLHLATRSAVPNDSGAMQRRIGIAVKYEDVQGRQSMIFCCMEREISRLTKRWIHWRIRA